MQKFYPKALTIELLLFSTYSGIIQRKKASKIQTFGIEQAYRLQTQRVIKVLMDEKITKKSFSRIIGWIYYDFP